MCFFSSASFSTTASTVVHARRRKSVHLLEGKYLQKTYILQLGSVSQLVNVHHMRSLHVDHQIPSVSKRRLTIDTVQPLRPRGFTTRTYGGRGRGRTGGWGSCNSNGISNGFSSNQIRGPKNCQKVGWKKSRNAWKRDWSARRDEVSSKTFDL